MLINLQIRNFKRFESVNVELGNTVVFIGPNNSGKTTALQALALWNIGLKQWNEKREGKSSPEKRPGVTINRNDLISLPVPVANLLWKDLHVRDAERRDGKPFIKNIRIGIIVSGISGGRDWSCGFEFDFANAESFYCRPMRLNENSKLEVMPVPEEVKNINMAFLPPMSGLAAIEPKWEPGRIGVLLGEGQTAQVLRNLCYQIFESSPNADWKDLVDHIYNLFGVRLMIPRYIKERGEITMSYEEGKTNLDLSSSGRGLQQTLLLLAFLYANPKTVLLLDEPDAHLEVLRQRQIYQLLIKVAESKESQIIAASHSEIIMNEAAGKDVVIAFVGKTPRRIDGRGQQTLKSLNSIGFDQYYQAEQMGWVLYLEGSTDLNILISLAEKINHPVKQYLINSPFVCYVGNQPSKARDHFFGLLDAKKDLIGIAIFDRLDQPLQENKFLKELMWKKRELENYFCKEYVLIDYAKGEKNDDLFEFAESDKRINIMKETIQEISSALKALKKPDPWSDDIKATDDFFDLVFDKYFEKLGLQNLLRKTNYHTLMSFLHAEDIDEEIKQKLDEILLIASKAKPIN